MKNVVQQVGVKFYVLTYMSVSRERNSGQNQNINIANNSPENVVKFRYCGTTLTDLNYMKVEMKERLNSGGMHGTSWSRIVLSSNMLSKSKEVFCHNEGRT